ncbi:AAA family ATPase [bacterium]|nr:AAA family ATPase [bacterium]
MKVKSISIQGFRGFNELRTIELDDRITLIFAPNSYGKTSISEALEWLLYGITSKVEKADSKDEYKGSYRNLHLDPSQPSFVNVTFLDNANEVKFAGALIDGDAILKRVDGNQVENWPFSQDISKCPPPFIMQHALKHLLLARPDERF